MSATCFASSMACFLSASFSSSVNRRFLGGAFSGGNGGCVGSFGRLWLQMSVSCSWPLVVPILVGLGLPVAGIGEMVNPSVNVVGPPEGGKLHEIPYREGWLRAGPDAEHRERPREPASPHALLPPRP